MNANRPLTPAWLAAGCHVPCPSTHGYSITQDYKSSENHIRGLGRAELLLTRDCTAAFFVYTEPNPQQARASSHDCETAAA